MDLLITANIAYMKKLPESIIYLPFHLHYIRQNRLIYMTNSDSFLSQLFFLITFYIIAILLMILCCSFLHLQISYRYPILF